MAKYPISDTTIQGLTNTAASKRRDAKLIHQSYKKLMEEGLTTVAMQKEITSQYMHGLADGIERALRVLGISPELDTSNKEVDSE